MNCFRLGPIDSPFDGSASRKAPDEEEEIGKGRKSGGKKIRQSIEMEVLPNRQTRHKAHQSVHRLRGPSIFP
jgi:hypothetical protein